MSTSLRNFWSSSITNESKYSSKVLNLGHKMQTKTTEECIDFMRWGINAVKRKWASVVSKLEGKKEGFFYFLKIANIPFHKLLHFLVKLNLIACHSLTYNNRPRQSLTQPGWKLSIFITFSLPPPTCPELAASLLSPYLPFVCCPCCCWGKQSASTGLWQAGK